MATDWSHIKAISYSFQAEPTSKYAKSQQHFARFHQDQLSGPAIEDMFTTQDDVRVLLPEAITNIRMKICDQFLEALDIDDDEEQRERMKDHIIVLLADTTIKGNIYGRPSSIRDNRKLNDMAEDAQSRNERAIHLELNISKWQFRKSWQQLEFMKIYLQGHEIESDDETTKKSTNDDDNESSQSTKSRENDRLVDLLEAQQSMIGDIAQIVARNNDDLSAATNERLAEALERLAEASANSTPHANTRTGQPLPISDDHWNHKELPDPVQERYEARNTYLTRVQMGTFKIENKDNDGNVTGTVDLNHYLHTKLGTNLQKLITRSGDCFDLSPLNDSRKVFEKQFLSNFPKLDGEEPAEIRKWYRAIVGRAKQFHIYVHPYYNFRRDVNHNRGFTIGDEPSDDLPHRYEDVLGEWGTMLHTALCQDKVIPDSCSTMKATVQNFEEGQGYEALWGVVKSTHPNHLRSYERNELVRSYPQQKEDERIEHYYFRFNDHLQMKAYLTHPCSLDDPQEISALIRGCLNHLELKDRANHERENPHQKYKYTSGNILGTLQRFEKEITFAKQQRSERSKLRTPSVIPRRTGRYSKPSRYSSNKTTTTGSSSLSSITHHNINLIDSIGYPDEDPSVPTEIWDLYINAIETLERRPREFDISRKCIICGETGHAFADCKALNNFQSLKDHRIAIGQFLGKLQILKQREIEARQKQISQLIAEMTAADDEDSHEEIAEEEEDPDFQLGRE